MVREGFKMNILKILGILLIAILNICLIAAVPTGPSNIQFISSGRYGVTTASNVSAVAGNLTELTFTANTVTQTWQGYFGNISGSIKLGDANNNTFYDWTSASPNGEIYATQKSDTPTWGSIACATQGQVNSEDTNLGINQATDQDSVNRTFLNNTAFNAFYVGNININDTQDCRVVNLYNSTAAPTTDFQELLLHDGTDIVYTALIKQDTLGFDSRTHDFQMLVGEDGHLGNTAPTPYYFYVELG